MVIIVPMLSIRGLNKRSRKRRKALESAEEKRLTIALSIGSIIRFLLTISMVLSALNSDWVFFYISLVIFLFLIWVEESDFGSDENNT